MKSVLNTTGAVAALFIAFTGPALAFPIPEPDSFALSGLGLGLVAAIYFLRKGKK